MIDNDLKLIIETAFDVYAADNGVITDDLNAVELKLGVKFPEALRDFYVTVGKHREIMDSDYHFTPIDDLQLVDNHLVIATENQSLAKWSINCNELPLENPQVLGKAEGDSKWYGESLRLSAFILHTVCWQAIMSMPEVVRCSIPQNKLDILEQDFEYIGEKQIRSGYRRYSFMNKKKGMLATYIVLPENLYIGAKINADLIELEDKLGLDLEWL